jgi:hydrogenase maturation factor
MMAATDVLLSAEDAGPAEDLAVASVVLARRFAAGATMWCLSTEWPAHGRHVAVEFVHPVIVGKRALPAVHLDGAGLATTLRLLARPGDVLLAVSTEDDPVTIDVLRRAETWGLTRIWLGAGPRRPSGPAEHVAWVIKADPGLAARSGDVVLLYHLLWELTHVVFEHPGLLVAEPDCTDEVCITCSDSAQVAEVQAVHSGAVATVLTGGRLQAVDVSLVDPVSLGDLVLVHAGVAVTAIDGEPS